jgi:hypothetical protein
MRDGMLKGRYFSEQDWFSDDRRMMAYKCEITCMEYVSENLEPVEISYSSFFRSSSNKTKATVLARQENESHITHR